VCIKPLTYLLTYLLTYVPGCLYEERSVASRITRNLVACAVMQSNELAKC